LVPTYGDYVLWSGTTPDAGGWNSPAATGVLTDAAINNSAAISSGYVYVYVYQDSAPAVGDSYVRSSIYGPPWGNPPPTGTDSPNVIDLAPDDVSAPILGTYHVVPEPGTMALFGLGMLTLAARRRRK